LHGDKYEDVDGAVDAPGGQRPRYQSWHLRWRGGRA
jgi:hypothetical protein